MAYRISPEEAQRVLNTPFNREGFPANTPPATNTGVPTDYGTRYNNPYGYVETPREPTNARGMIDAALNNLRGNIPGPIQNIARNAYEYVKPLSGSFDRAMRGAQYVDKQPTYPLNLQSPDMATEDAYSMNLPVVQEDRYDAMFRPPKLQASEYDPVRETIRQRDYEKTDRSDPWAKVIGKSALQMGPATGLMLGGAYQAAEDVLGVRKGMGKTATDFYRKELANLTPIAKRGTAKSYAGQAIGSVSRNIPGMVGGAAVAYATGNPMAGARTALNLMSAQVAGEKYPEMRSAGFSVPQSLITAGGYGAAERIGEELPIGNLFKQGLPFVKRLVTQMGLEIPGELVTETLQAGMDKGTIDPQMSVRDFGERLKDVLIVTPLATFGQTAIMHPVIERMGDNGKPEINYEKLSELVTLLGMVDDGVSIKFKGSERRQIREAIAQFDEVKRRMAEGKEMGVTANEPIGTNVGQAIEQAGATPDITATQVQGKPMPVQVGNAGVIPAPKTRTVSVGGVDMTLDEGLLDRLVTEVDAGRMPQKKAEQILEKSLKQQQRFTQTDVSAEQKALEAGLKQAPEAVPSASGVPVEGEQAVTPAPTPAEGETIVFTPQDMQEMGINVDTPQKAVEQIADQLLDKKITPHQAAVRVQDLQEKTDQKEQELTKTYKDYQEIHTAVREKKLKIGDKAKVSAYGGINVEIIAPEYKGELNDIGIPIEYKIKELTKKTQKEGGTTQNRYKIGQEVSVGVKTPGKHKYVITDIRQDSKGKPLYYVKNKGWVYDNEFSVSNEVTPSTPQRGVEKTKEPWQMTRDEYIKSEGGELDADRRYPSHIKAIAAALKEGKPIPAEVLKDYPELQKKETPPPAPAKAGQSEAQKPAVSLEQEALKYKTAEEWVDKEIMKFDDKGIGITKYEGGEHSANVLDEDNFGDIVRYYELHITSKEGNWKDGHSEYDNIKNPIVRFRLTERHDGSDLMVEEVQMPSKANRADMPSNIKNNAFDIGIKKFIKYAEDKGYNSIVLPGGEDIVVGQGATNTPAMAKFYDTIIKNKIIKQLGEPETTESYSYWELDANKSKSQLTAIWNKAHGRSEAQKPAVSLEQEALKYKTAETFVGKKKYEKGIKKYNFSDDEGFDEIISDIEQSRTEHGEYGIGLRGIHKQEEGRKIPRNSYDWTDKGGETTRESIPGKSKRGGQLKGVSVINIERKQNWDDMSYETAKDAFEKSYEMAKGYGTGKVAIIIGRPNLNEAWVDDYAGEAVFTNSKVIGYIDNSSLTKSQLTALWNKAHGKGETPKGMSPGFLDITPITYDMLRDRIKETKQNIKEAMSHLEEMGRRVYGEGKQKFTAWQMRMKEILKDAWGGFKNHMSNVFGRVKKWWQDQGKAGIVAPGFEGRSPKEMRQAARRRFERMQSEFEWMKDIPDDTNAYPEITKIANSAKDIPQTWVHGNDFYRNIGRTFGQAGQKIINQFDAAKAEYMDTLTNSTNALYNDIVKGLGIDKGSKLSEAIMDYGEGIKGDGSKYTLDDLKGDFPKEWEKVVQADKWFRMQYDRMLGEVNKVRAQIYPNNPDKQIPRRQDYYRHFQELVGFEGLKNLFESPAGIDPALVGISDITKPKSRFLSFAQKRLGLKSERDAVGGFLNYIDAFAYAKGIDPQIAAMRTLSKEIIKATPDTANLNNMILFLNRFADDLAGKTNPAERWIQEVIPGGRKTFKVLDWMNKRIKGNQVLANVASSINQISNVPAGIASAKQYSLQGAQRTLAQLFHPNAAMEQDRWITERYKNSLFNRFDKGILADSKKFAAWMTGVLDEVGTKFTWNAHYEKALKEGIPNPIEYARNKTRAIVAGRGIGEVPLYQKAKLTQFLAPFQLEVGNLWRNFGDWRREGDWAAFPIYMVAAYLLGSVISSLTGNRPLFDPIDAVVQGTKTLMKEKDKAKGAIKAAGRLAGEVIGNIPFGQTAVNLLPDRIGGMQKRDIFGNTVRISPPIITKLAEPQYSIFPPFGGAQAKKTIAGAKSLYRGYATNKGGNITYPVSRDITNAIEAVVFGPYNVREARDYFDNERRALSPNQTKEVMKYGKGRYNDIMHTRAINKKFRNMTRPKQK